MSDRINTKVPIIERADLAARFLPAELLEVGARMFMMNGCSIIVANEPNIGWHISIARVDRDPTWDEIVTARYRLLPQVPNMVMHLPTSGYVNLQKHTFHLHEHNEARLNIITPLGQLLRP